MCVCVRVCVKERGRECCICMCVSERGREGVCVLRIREVS